MGFLWNDTHTNDLDVLAQLKTLPLLPEPKTITEDVQTMDGVYDFSAYNADGRVHYKTRRFEYDCAFQGKSKNSMAAKQNALAALFFQREGYLVDSGIPGVRWKCRIVNKIDINRAVKYLDKFNVVFEADPFSEALEPAEYNIDTAATVNAHAFTIKNRGFVSVKPDIELTWDVEPVDGIKLYFDTEDNGSELQPGTHKLYVGNVFSGKLTVSFREKYLWGVTR